MRSMLGGTLQFRKAEERSKAAKKIDEEVLQVIYKIEQNHLHMSFLDPPLQSTNR